MDSLSLSSRLYKTILRLKIRLVILSLFIISAVLYIFLYISNLNGVPIFFSIFKTNPFPALADACLTSAIVGLTFEILVRTESEAGLRYMQKELLNEQTSIIMDEIPQKLLLNRDIQLNVFKQSKIEEIIQNALHSSFPKQNMGKGIFNSFIKKCLLYKECWSNYKYEIFIEDITDPNIRAEIREGYFDIITRITYDTELNKTQYIFECINSHEKFNKDIWDYKYEVTWLMPKSDLFPSPNETCFELLNIFIDDIPLTIIKNTNINDQIEYVCEHPDLKLKLGKKVTVSYTFRVKAEKLGHAISTTIIYPTFDIAIELNFAKASIEYIEVLDYFISMRNPAIRYIPSKENPYKITLELKDWAFPKGGAVFVWVLKNENKLLTKCDYEAQQTEP